MTTPLPLPPNLSLPPSFRAGDALTWQVQTQLAPGSAVFYVLTAVVNNTPVRQQIGTATVVNAIPIIAIDENGVGSFSLTSAVTASWQPGRYKWVLFAFDGTNRTELAQGVLRVDPDPAGTNPIDTRSLNERMLAQIKALLSGKALDDVAMYKIGSRELTKIPWSELTKLEADYEGRVRRERARRKGADMRVIPVHFGGH